MKITPRLTLVFILFATVLLFGVGILAYQSGRSVLEATTIAELEATSLEKSAALDAWIAERKADITALSHSPAILGELEILLADSSNSKTAYDRLIQELAVHTGPDQPYLGFFIMSPTTGEVLLATNPREEGKFKEDRPFFMQGRIAPFVSKVYYSLELQGPAITASAPLRTEDGQMLGVLAGRLNLGDLDAIIQRRTGLRQTDDAFLVNASRLFVTQPHLLPDPAVLQRGVHTEAVKRCLQSRSNGTISTLDYRDVPSIITFRWLPQHEMCLIVKMDEMEALAPVQTFGKTIGWIALLTLAAASIIAFALSRSITHPILAMQSVVQQYGRGYLDIRLQEMRPDELGVLAREFNQMAAGLLEKENQVREYAAQLEQKVDERTAQLKQSEERYRGLIESQLDLIVRVDLEGRFTFVNDAYCQKFGLDREVILGRESYKPLIHPDDLPHTLEAMKALYQHPYRATMEQRAFSVEGVRWIEWQDSAIRDETGQIVEIQAIGRDITERKQSEENLRRFELLSQHSRDIIFFMRREDGRILEANAAATQAYGYSHEELLSFNIQDLRSPKTQDLTADQMAQADAEGILFETIHQCKDGNTFPVEVSSRGATIGGVHALVSIVRDITDRQRSEEERRLAEDRYTALFNFVQEGFAHYKAIYDQGKLVDILVVEINPAGAKMSGVARDDQVGKTWRQVWSGVDEALFATYQQIDETGETVRFDNDNDLTNRVYDVTISRISPGHFMATFNDVTERKQAEEALRESEERYRGLFGMMQEGLVAAEIITDENGHPIDYRYLDVNPATERQFGLPREGFIGRTCTELLPQGDPEWIEILGKVALTGEPVSLERYAKASQRWLECHIYSPRLGQVVNITSDITDRKRVEEQLRYQATLLSNVNDAIIASDAQFRLTAWNLAAESLYGWKEEEVLGRNGLEIVRTEWPEKDAGEMRRTIAETGQWRGEATQLRKDGTRFPVDVSSIVLHDDNGQVISYISVNRDITERKQAEGELQRITEDLRHSNAELEQFAYIASHDLQEPLRMVSSYVQLLRKRYEGRLDQDADEFITYAHEGATRMKNLINDLLAYSRVGTRGKPLVVVSSESVVEEAITNLQVASEESAANITYGSLPQIQGDPTQLVQLFQNLLSNAIKFRGSESPRIRISARREESEWVFCVSDNGIGIDPKFAERIFVIFQRLHNRDAYPGTGIGLAICKRIVQRHGGRIWVESQPGTGAAFYFTVPIKDLL